jgi:hypothetical protein
MPPTPPPPPPPQVAQFWVVINSTIKKMDIGRASALFMREIIAEQGRSTGPKSRNQVFFTADYAGKTLINLLIFNYPITKFSAEAHCIHRNETNSRQNPQHGL